MLKRHASFATRLSGIFAAAFLLAACSPQTEPTEREPGAQSTRERQEALAAQQALSAASKNYYLPSAVASGGLRTQLLARAEAAYTKLVAQYPSQTNVAAQAWRNLGNVLAEQDRVREAVSAYAQVATSYPTAEWEILQTTKASGDLLWDHGQTNEALPHYRALVGRYQSRTNEAEIIALIVKGAQNRLREAGAPNR